MVEARMKQSGSQELSEWVFKMLQATVHCAFGVPGRDPGVHFTVALGLLRRTSISQLRFHKVKVSFFMSDSETATLLAAVVSFNAKAT